jgi:hypothetical protein
MVEVLSVLSLWSTPVRRSLLLHLVLMSGLLAACVLSAASGIDPGSFGLAVGTAAAAVLLLLAGSCSRDRRAYPMAAVAAAGWWLVGAAGLLHAPPPVIRSRHHPSMRAAATTTPASAPHRAGGAAEPGARTLPAADPRGARIAAVGPVVRELALLYSGIGQDVQAEVFGDPWVQVDSHELNRLLASLLANCARHAPQARVRVRAAGRGPRVRIEIIDDGPGLPPGSTARLFRRGVCGAGSTGAGLGLAVCSELAERYRGSFTVISTSGGCTAVVEFPTATRSASTEVATA